MGYSSTTKSIVLHWIDVVVELNFPGPFRHRLEKQTFEEGASTLNAARYLANLIVRHYTIEHDKR